MAEKNHFSSQTLLGLAEAPKEALLSDCWPNFSSAWLTKLLLKLLWLPSTGSISEMIRRHSILFTKMLRSWLSGQIKSKHVGWELILGSMVVL
ncbi:hypothetical protein RDABS01_006033 [Bienertia sinuspersici]